MLTSTLDSFLAAARATERVMTSPITMLFESYRGMYTSLIRIFYAGITNPAPDDPIESPDTIGITRAMDFLRDINVELDEVACLGIAEQLKSPSMGEFTREGFVRGWVDVR
jgi:DCN1-like protein 1/2